MPGNPEKPRLLLWAWVSVAIFVISLLALTALQYRMPEDANSYFGLNHDGVRIFQEQLFGETLYGMDVGTYMLAFRLLLVVVWMSYGAAVFLGLRGSVLKPKTVIALTALVAIALAVFWPASLSNDSFAYIAYARMQVLYGQNPYAVSPTYLETVKDPTAWSIPWKMLSSYGSVWTLLSIGLITLLKNAGLWWQEVAMKLIQAGALIGAALAGRRIAGYLYPGKENLALLAIGLNPLLLIEGPGNGHNDMLMTCLLLMAVACFLARKWLLGGLIFGLSIGVKLITIAALPWVITEYVRSKGERNKAVNGVALVLLAVAPVILCYLPFLSQGSPLGGILQRWAWGSYVHAGSSAMKTAIRVVPLLIIYGIVTFRLWRYPRPGQWLTAWIPFSLALIFLTSRIWFPWYFIWPWAVSLTLWDRLHVRVSYAGLVGTLVLSFLYSITLIRL